MTSRAALAASRSLDILDFLAANPGQGHTMTELARGLDINPSSMHGLLGVMVEAGYVVRHPVHKTYRLGPTAAAVGQAAIAQDPAVELAVAEVARLTDEVDMESVVLHVVRDEMLVVGRSGPSTGRFLSFIGQRWPHAAPMGSIFVAWADRPAVDRWLDSADPPLSAADRRAYEDVLGRVRSDGRAIVAVEDTRWTLMTNSPGADPNPLVAAFDPSLNYRVFYIGQPVFNGFGEVALGLFVNGPSVRLPAERIGEVAGLLADAAGRVMSRTGGRMPVARSA